jgi:site-specific DNA-methyltransferase (adenine-specific)
VREEVIGDCRLILGDCLQIMADLPAIDHVITDPPYEAYMHAAKRGEKVFGSARRIRIDGHANPPPVEFSSIDGIRRQSTELMTNICSGWLIIFCTPEGVAAWRDEIEAADVRYKRACVWVKPDSAPQFNGQGPAMGAEMFVTAWCGKGFSQWNGGGRRNVFTFPTNNADRQGEHPTEKPIALMTELVELFTNEGQTVLDPFMGSGTTGVASVKRGRLFIGIEKDPKWFDLSCRRIEQAYRQPDFLVQPKEKLKQESML